MRTAGKILWTIVKLLFRIFLIFLWGGCRLAELIFQQLNIFLNHIITKPNNKHYK